MFGGEKVMIVVHVEKERRGDESARGLGETEERERNECERDLGLPFVEEEQIEEVPDAAPLQDHGQRDEVDVEDAHEHAHTRAHSTPRAQRNVHGLQVFLEHIAGQQDDEAS